MGMRLSIFAVCEWGKINVGASKRFKNPKRLLDGGIKGPNYSEGIGGILFQSLLFMD